MPGERSTTEISDAGGSKKKPIECCSDLMEWIGAHGPDFSVTAENSSTRFQIRYFPSALRLCMDPLSAGGSFAGLSNDIVSESRKTTQYVLEVSPKGQEGDPDSDPIDINESNVFSIEGTDTIPSVFVHREVGLPSLPFRRYILGFEHMENPLDKVIFISDPLNRIGGGCSLKFNPGVFEEYEQLNLESTLVRWGV